MTSAEQATVSVVIPTHNRSDLLARCLRAVASQRHDAFEVIVVDDASEDDTQAVTRREAPAARLVRLARNEGFAAAANAGAAAATGRYVAFLNSDAEPQPDWLAELVQALERRPRAASAEPKTLRLDRPDVIDGAGISMTWSLKAYRRGAGERDEGQFDESEEVFAASATACLWRAEAFRELGGFDPSFFAYYEDVDLGFRARLAGYESWYVPTAVVLHHGGASGAKLGSRRVTASVTNRWRVAVRNAPAAWLVRRAPTILAGEAMWLLASAARGDALAHLRAYASIVRSLRSWKRDRDTRASTASDAVSRLVLRRFPPFRIAARQDARRGRATVAPTGGTR